MSRTRQIMVACGTFSVALGIGFVMQNGDALAARFSETPPPPVMSLVPNVPAPVQSAQADADTASLPIIGIVAATHVIDELHLTASVITQAALTIYEAAPQMPAEIAPPAQLAALEADLPPAIIDTPMLASPDCAASLDATVMPAAMVTLTLFAPCSPDTRVTIHHHGMIFSILSDAAGQATVNVPALDEAAVFLADLGTGEGAVTVVTVPDLANFDRAVLQWQGVDGPEIHVREFGATYGEDGHIWHQASRDAGTAIEGTGGFLVRLGDPAAFNPLMAEVYTYPSGQGLRDGKVDISVETPVTANNCGRELSAQTIQVSPGADPISLDLSLTVPGCETVGEYLVMNQMLFDLTLVVR